MDITAEALLQNYDLSSLQQMAKEQEVKVGKGGKSVFVTAIAKGLFDSARIERALDKLSQPERTLLDRVILAGGDTQTTLVRNQLEGEGVTDKPVKSPQNRYSYYNRERGSVRNLNSRRFEDLVTRLGVVGLLFTEQPAHSSGYIVSLTEPGHRLYIPDAILKTLPSVKLDVESAPAPASVRQGDAAPLLRDLYLLFSLADRETIALTNRGLIMKRSLTKIGQVLGREQEVAGIKTEDQLAGFSLLRGLAEELGLLASSVGQLLLDPRGEQFLALPSAERRQRLFSAYRTTTHWSELHRVPDLGARGKGLNIYAPPANVVPARQRVLAELLQMPVGEWVSIEHLVNRLRISAYEFLISRTPAKDSYYSYNYRYYGYGHYNPYEQSVNGLGLTLDIADERSGWNIAEAGFIRVVLTDALHSLGVVDLGGDDDTATLFRVTEDGGRLLRGEPLTGNETSAQVVIQPNFQVFAFQPTGEDILFMLDRIADHVRTGQAMEYELTQASMYRAQRSGLDTTAVIGFLEGVSTHELPQNVRRTLEEWGAQHERVTLRKHAPILQTTDETTLNALYADEAVGVLLGRRLAPTLAVVPAEHLLTIYQRMVDHGQLAALTEGPGYQPGPQLSVAPDGVVTFRQRQPSIYALAELRTFADELETGTVRLTPDSLRHGARTGLDADGIIATLERLSGGTLPDEPAALVRRWAKDWGSGALYDATILQLDQPQQLADLMADPDVRPHLQPIPGVPTIAIVPAKSRQRVRKLLEARGMTLRDA